ESASSLGARVDRLQTDRAVGRRQLPIQLPASKGAQAMVPSRNKEESSMAQERKKIPAEAVELYTRYIHGEVSRRDFLDGVKRYAVAGLTAGTIVEALTPNYALGQQVRKDDERIKASYETVPSPDGHGYVRGYFVRPFSANSRTETPAKLP